MINDIQKIRAEMIKARLFSRRELGQFRWLSPGMQQQRDRLQDAFDVNHPVVTKMATCGQIDDWNNVRYCGLPLCPRCFLRERKDQTRQAIRSTFSCCANEDLAFATILLPPIMCLSDLRQIMNKEKRKFVNLANRKRRQDIKWDSFQMLGWWEVDRMEFGALQNAGRKTRIALEALGMPLLAADNDTFWRPHLHVIIQTGGVPLEEIKLAFKADGHSGPYQVDIQPFDVDRPVNRNIQRIVRYCLKFRIEDDFKGKRFADFDEDDRDAKKDRSWWPDKDIRAYVAWLKGDDMSGFRSLRFALGKKQKTAMNAASKMVSPETCPNDECVMAAHAEPICAGTLVTNGGVQGESHSISQRCKVAAMKVIDDGGRNKKVILDTN
ncbi:hypothetical protein GCM10010924_13490 [Rhizobium wenxiniae]|uniref:Replication protein n=1 Tax=Rhizobium wenxiniae TaxID=1737357 RepID=A0A7W9Y3M7_9HYPH|nr:hypothetical protein [Rhizobium wenxiniae]MBB6161197.1 hypothetical protein [Rhizobium wenxiniae]GGF87081.1 hypothetical protein GCM10010924_13490 [Rhizobium wenxiniae]